MMYNYFRKVILIVVTVFTLSLSAEDQQKVRILGIGNSFTRNVTRYLNEICKTDPNVNADIAMAYIGGSSLDYHARLGKLAETDPENPKALKYKYVLNTKWSEEYYNLIEILKKQEWDYITIQQVSHKSYKPETYQPYALELQDLIKKYAPQAQLILHETWAYRVNCSRLEKWNMTPVEMYTKLHAAYLKAAKELKVPVIPVGTAFEEAKKHPHWDYQPPENFYPEKLVYPAKLPDESTSLHSGYHWSLDKKTGKRRVTMDGYHASHNGEYLGGLIWYEFFFKGDARKVTFAPKNIAKPQANSLREAAHTTMSERKWNESF